MVFLARKEIRRFSFPILQKGDLKSAFLELTVETESFLPTENKAVVNETNLLKDLLVGRNRLIESVPTEVWKDLMIFRTTEA